MINNNTIDSNTLAAIASVCAVFVSIVSIVITIVFSRLQVIHNKNSVRPISAIKLNDYEDEIAVKLQNVGTGPLIINKVYFKKDSKTFSTLIEMMPKINQYWSTYTECIDGWTIPVSGQLILIKLSPNNAQIKESVRKELSKITAYVEYVDIYNTKFYDQRTLDFFGRHYKQS